MFEEQGLLNLHDFEARARVVMRKGIFDMVDGGFNDEITYKRTQAAFDSLGLVPRYMKDVSHVDTSTTLLGHQITLPVLPAPSAPQIGAHPDGDLATCRAAGAIGTIEILSHGSDFTIELFPNANHDFFDADTGAFVNTFPKIFAWANRIGLVGPG